MVTMAQVASFRIGPTSQKQCATCSSENPIEAPFCQVCGTLLGTVACPKCNHTSQSDAHHCTACGHSFRESVDISESVEAAAPAARAEAGGVSPTALIGFGAVLSLAAAAYPWYLFGTDGAAVAQQASLFGLLADGWAGSQAIPLIAIVIAAVTSSVLSSARPAVAVLSGAVTLLSAVWLANGLAGDPAALTTGAVLVTIGAIIVMAGGLHMRSARRVGA